MITVKRCRIGLFGCYWVRNFGDDLMGLLFAKAFAARGHEVTAFGLSGYEGVFGLKVAPTIQDMVDESDVIVLGGGGFLVPRRVSTDSHRTMESHCQTLCNGLRRRDLPLYALSVGGNGAGVRPTDLTPAWQELLGQANGISVRNEADLPLAEALCGNAIFAPDVVWRAPTLCDLPNRAEAMRPTMALNVNAVSRSRGRPNPKATLARLLLPMYRVREVQAGVVQTPDDNPYDGLVALMTELRDAQVTVSHKLHLGLAAWSFGNSFISFMGPAKTRVVMDELNVDGFCGRSIASLVAKLGKTWANHQRYAVPAERISDLSHAAAGHFDFFFESLTRSTA